MRCAIARARRRSRWSRPAPIPMRATATARTPSRSPRARPCRTSRARCARGAPSSSRTDSRSESTGSVMRPAIATKVRDAAPSRMTIAGIVRTAALLLAMAWSAGSSASADDLLARSRAAYAGLHSYSDTGTVVVEFGNAPTPSREQHTFRTWYRAPRLFRFEFTKAKQADRYEVWSDEQVFRTWWKATGGISTYPKGQGASAFTTGSVTTYGALTSIAPWLFPQAGLTGTLTE